MIKKIISSQEELESLYLIQTLLDSGSLLFVTSHNEKIQIPSDLLRTITETVFHILRGRRLLLVPESEFVSTTVAGEILSLPPRSVVYLIKQGELQATMIGKKYSIRLQDVLHYKIMHQL